MRRFKVTLGIAALGSVAGALAGGISALVVVAVVDQNVQTLFDGLLFLIGAEIGAPLGALLLPIAAWTLMRYVPLGRAFLGTVAGTMLGAFLGWFISTDSNAFFRSITGGIVGFVLAAVLLRLRARAGSSIPARVI